MTAIELIQHKSHEVRRDSNLMAFYIQLFSDVMGYTPNCAGCTFKIDWKKFTHSVLIKSGSSNFKAKYDMAQETTFKLKPNSSKIYTYIENGRPIRSYGRNMTEDFAINFLTKGTPQQLEERKKLFIQLPQLSKDEVQEIGRKELTRKELNVLASDLGLNPSDYGNKAEIIAAINSI